MIGIDVLVSTLAGAVGGIANKWLEKGIKKDDRAHELAMAEINERSATAEREHTLAISKQEAIVAEQESSWNAFTVGQIEANKNIGIGWVDACRSMTRVVITIYLVIVSSVLAMDMSELVGGLDSLPENRVAELYDTVIHSLLNLTGISVGFWFSSRFTLKK